MAEPALQGDKLNVFISYTTISPSRTNSTRP
jgi:hypothetical protein